MLNIIVKASAHKDMMQKDQAKGEKLDKHAMAKVTHDDHKTERKDAKFKYNMSDMGRRDGKDVSAPPLVLCGTDTERLDAQDRRRRQRSLSRLAKIRLRLSGYVSSPALPQPPYAVFRFVADDPGSKSDRSGLSLFILRFFSRHIHVIPRFVL